MHLEPRTRPLQQFFSSSIFFPSSLTWLSQPHTHSSAFFAAVILLILLFTLRLFISWHHTRWPQTVHIFPPILCPLFPTSSTKTFIVHRADNSHLRNTFPVFESPNISIADCFELRFQLEIHVYNSSLIQRICLYQTFSPRPSTKI